MHKAVKISLWIGIPALVLCGSGGWYASQWVDFYSASRDLDNQVAEAKRLGLPLEAKELEPNPPISSEENAGPEFLEAGKLFQSVPNSTKLTTEAFDAIKKGDYSTAKQVLANFKLALDKIELAVKKPKCYVDRDLDMGPDILFPEFAQWKGITKMLSARAQIRAHEGDTDGALHDIRAMDAVVRFTGGDVFLIGMLVQIAEEAIRLKAVEAIASQWAKDAGKITALRRTLAVNVPQTDLKAALKSEFYMPVAICRNFDAFGGMKGLSVMSSGEDFQTPRPPVDPAKLIRKGLPSAIMARAFFARHLQFWNKYYRETEGEDDPVKLTKKLDKMSTAEVKEKGLSYLLNKIVHPVFGQAGFACARMIALQRCTESLLAVLEYRAKKGAFPSSLAEAGVTALDPFDGLPLRYSHTASSCRVYSVGMDLRDDGGIARSEIGVSPDGSPRRFDEVVSYPPVVSKK